MELKIGGKITLSENEVYYILEIVNYEGKKYLFCTTAVGKIEPAILQVAEIDEKTKVRTKKNPVIIKNISIQMLERDDKELLQKILYEN